jgi:CheY-like chemotaxis protein
MSGEDSLRIVVGEDQPLTRKGVVAVLEEAGFEVVAVAGDAPDLLRKTARRLLRSACPPASSHCSFTSVTCAPPSRPSMARSVTRSP